jgi:hypothetical protein
VGRSLPPLSADELAELVGAGAVGEIGSRFFDCAGQPCDTAFDRRLVALDLRQLRAVPLVIGVAAGQHKAAAILGAVRGGYLKALVTDDLTASAVLALARGGSDSAPGPNHTSSSANRGSSGSAGPVVLQGRSDFGDAER